MSLSATTKISLVINLTPMHKIKTHLEVRITFCTSCLYDNDPQALFSIILHVL
jgi:hypothetical protein